MSFFPLRIHQNRCRLGLLPRPHWGSLQHSTRPFSWLRGRRGMEGREGLGGGGKTGREEKGGVGKGGQWGSWGIAPWLWGDRPPYLQQTKWLSNAYQQR